MASLPAATCTAIAAILAVLPGACSRKTATPTGAAPTGAPPANASQEARPRTVVIGCIGQSNMLGVANVDQHPALPSLDGIRIFQPDLFAARDDVGVFTQLDFAPERYDVPTATFDYPVNAGVPPRFASVRLFGPELHAGVVLRERFGAPVHFVKLAVGGVGLVPLVDWPVGLPSGWMWFVHDSWDPSLPHSVRPYESKLVLASRATTITATTLRDAGQNWNGDEHKGRWLVCGGKQGRVLGNDRDTLTIEAWVQDPLGAPPAPGPYVLEDRTFFHASLARAFAEGYLAGAAAACGPGGIDCRGVLVAQGETDGLREASARAAKANMQALIAYLRTTMQARGFTTLRAEQVPFVLALVKESEVWPFAQLVNAGYRELAANDPFVVVVDTQDVALGGFDGVDRNHYSAAGQQLLGERMATALLELHTKLPLPAGR